MNKSVNKESGGIREIFLYNGKTIGVSKIIRPQQSYEVLPLCQIDDFSLYFISNKAEKVCPPVKYVPTPLQSN